MKTLKVLIGVVASLGLSLSAQAATINIVPGDACFDGPETSQNDIDNILYPATGTGPCGFDNADELYKSNVGGVEEKSLAGSYETEYSNTENDPSDALVTYVSGAFISGQAWMVVKDGNQDPGWYLFDLTDLGWNGTDDLSLTGFWPDQGAISHISLYGSRGVDVPEPGTLALLGLGLMGFGLARRRRA